MSIKQAVILAGGLGNRLRPLTDIVPKPLAPINGIPFLDYLINSLVNVGINNIVLLLGYKYNLIVSRYKYLTNIIINFSIGNISDDTGTRLLNSYELLNEDFLFLYGDNYWPIELSKMWSNYKKKNASISTTVFSNLRGTGEYGKENNIVVGSDGSILDYDKSRTNPDANGVDIGYFILSKNVLDVNIKKNVSFELDILPTFVAAKKITAYMTNEQYYYITTIDSLKNFEQAVKQNDFKPLSDKYFSKKLN